MNILLIKRASTNENVEDNSYVILRRQSAGWSILETGCLTSREVINQNEICDVIGECVVTCVIMRWKLSEMYNLGSPFYVI